MKTSNRGSGIMSKLNKILLDWKPGDIHGAGWLRAREIDQRLAYSYYEDGYLEKIGPGVFARKGDEINPYGVVRFLQQELELKVHLSGRTALELQGHSHYVALGPKTRIYLTSYEAKSFPTWIKKLEKNFEFVFKKSSLLEHENFLTTHNESGFELRISTRELAALELIETLDLSGSLETAENYTQSLLTLRPEVLQKVLEVCHSIKAKRVFLYLAEKLNLPWFKKIKKESITLGVGKRVIVKGGEFNKKYQITVDRNYGENPF
jgi:Transcriptional regulator, AbiEi antitoxin, Type IV TA system/Transcriptional regulator, AbiEi antitoxin N-terminal domain